MRYPALYARLCSLRPCSLRRCSLLSVVYPYRVVCTLVVVLVAFLLVFPFTSTAHAMPSDQDIAAAKNAESQTAASLAGVQLQLTQLEAQSAQLSQTSDEAQKKFDAAVAAAEQAQQEAEKAQQQADEAMEAVDAARKNMGSIAQAMYQNSAARISQAYYFLDADSLADGAAKDRAYALVADNADQKMKSFEALQDVAAHMQKRANEKKQASQELMQEADVAADKAAQAAAAAQAQVEDTAGQKAQLEVELAGQKAATAKLESERAAALEAQRIAQEKAAAIAAAEKAAQQALLAAPVPAAGNQAAPAPAPPAASSPAAVPSQGASSKPIIDISEWQSPSAINYDALAASVSGVVIRIGYTGTYSGSSYNKDQTFDRHYAEFTKRGIPVGAYWYSCANEGNEGAAEAQAALRFLNGRHLDMPLYIDVEDPTHQAWASQSVLTDQSLKFSSAVRAGGYASGVYASSSWYYSKLDLNSLRGSGMSIWVAQWSAYAPSIGYDLWQYSSSGYLPGYGGRLDVNQR